MKEQCIPFAFSPGISTPEYHQPVVFFGGLGIFELLVLVWQHKQEAKRKILAGHQRLTPVILVTQEAEIRRITV
jgi:hypothetical protein